MQNKNIKGGLFLFIKILGVPLFVLAGFFIFGHSVRAIDISDDVTWTKAQSPVIIKERVWVMPGATLTIEAGVAVKLYPNQFITMSGALSTLKAVGTAGEPIVFTSIRDDEYGGDTNGDGGASQPQIGDWWSLFFANGAIGDLENVIIKYGGVWNYQGVNYYSAAISTFKSNVNIANSIITNNGGGISNRQGPLIITNSSIYNNLQPFWKGEFFDFAIGNNAGTGSSTVKAINNWWGTSEEPCVYRDFMPPGIPTPKDFDLRALCGARPLIDWGVSYSPWLTAPPSQKKELEPVIIVPGIMGSWNIRGAWLIDPILHTYDNLIEALGKNGYTLNENLFLLPYDWRESNTITASLLKGKITEVKAKTGRNKVDIVAHSMGGLASRYYVQSSEYQNDVDQLIFLNTPHQGAPESYLAYEGGYFLGKIGRIIKFIFQIESTANGYLSLSKYIREKVLSVEQLLPVYPYLEEKVGGSWASRFYPVQYPRNLFLENLNLEDGLAALKTRASVTNIFSHSETVGASTTLGIIKVAPDPDIYDNEWMDGYPENLEEGDISSLILGDGDSTVPIKSSSYLAGVETVEMAGAGHREIVTKAQKEVIAALSGKIPEEEASGPWGAVKRILFIRVYSPVDFAVVSPDGRIIGKDFSANTDINQIPGAFYSGFDSAAEFVTIPEPAEGNYQVILKGTGSGVYKLGADILEDGDLAQAKENITAGIISAGEKEVFDFSYSSTSSQLIVKKDVTFKGLLEDMEELYQYSEIKEKSVLINLKARIEHLNRKYDDLVKEDNIQQQELIQRHIENYFSVILKDLDFYLEKGWITSIGRNILENNIYNIFNKLI